MIKTVLENLFQDRDLGGNSEKWANWKSVLGLTTCLYCAEQHGKIVDIAILENKQEVNAHKNCKCIYVPMRTKEAGTATTSGEDGADVYLLYFHILPDYYVNKKQAEKSGWKKWLGNLADVLPGKMIGGDVYKNRNVKLPQAPGRVWYEADINYISGRRNTDRIVYSNDGLIFVSYDHYQTFYELTE